MQEKVISIDGEISFGYFKNRPNRFLVNLKPEKTNKIEPAFLHDPGRMKELLTPNVRLLLRKPLTNKERKTKWDILGVEHKDRWVVINSSLPNLVAKRALRNEWISELVGYLEIKPEVSVGKSRLDFKISNKNEDCYLEVKGVTLVKDSKALFPDAPTTRGTRHLQELIELKRKGIRSVVLFICMREDPLLFSPNWDTDPEFSKKLKLAEEAGVEILVYKVHPQIIDSKLHLLFQSRIKVDI